MSISVEELIEAKRNFEYDLCVVFQEKITEFVNKTGVKVSGISLGIADVTSIHDTKKTYVVSGARVDIDLT